MDEERTKRYIAMTSQTDDPEREQAYLPLLSTRRPEVEPLVHALNEGSCARRPGGVSERYALLDRAIESRVALFRSENVPLETEDSKLKQQLIKRSRAR